MRPSQVASAGCRHKTWQASICICMAGACKARGNCTAGPVLQPNAVLGLLFCFFAAVGSTWSSQLLQVSQVPTG